jgi:RNA polymerase sigma factor FliA
VSLRASDPLDRELRLYMPWVIQCVNAVIRRVPPNVQRDDLLSAGSVGLLRALRKATNRDHLFEGYARRCIRGAVLDEMRRADWVNRRLRTRIKKGLVTHSTIGIDDLPPGFDLPDTRSLVGFERADARRALIAPLKTLEPRDALIVRLHYIEGVPFNEIASRLKVSEPRISQLHARALQRLRAAIEAPAAPVVTAVQPSTRRRYTMQKPRAPRGLYARTRAQLERAQRLRAAGFSQRVIAAATGLSRESVAKYTMVVSRSEAMRQRWRRRLSGG